MQEKFRGLIPIHLLHVLIPSLCILALLLLRNPQISDFAIFHMCNMHNSNI